MGGGRAGGVGFHVRKARLLPPLTASSKPAMQRAGFGYQPPAHDWWQLSARVSVAPATLLKFDS